jgi:hypothetical protein
VAGVEAKTMNCVPLGSGQPARCELRFRSLYDTGRCLAFPCDSAGNVDIDVLSDRARQNYYYARTLIGREFAHPSVVIATEH